MDKKQLNTPKTLSDILVDRLEPADIDVTALNNSIAGYTEVFPGTRAQLATLSIYNSKVACFSCDAGFDPESQNNRKEGWFCDACLVNPCKPQPRGNE